MSKYKTISVGETKCVCKNCGNDFSIYRLSDFVYGERIILTEDSGNYAYVNCFEDKVFDEVGHIVGNFYKGKNVTQSQMTKYFNKVYGFACDYIDDKMLDASNIEYACTNCGSKQFEVIKNSTTSGTKISLPIISHECWNQKNQNEKENLILDALKQEKCI